MTKRNSRRSSKVILAEAQAFRDRMEGIAQLVKAVGFALSASAVALEVLCRAASANTIGLLQALHKLTQLGL